MAHLTQAELIEFMNVMLEGERAGAKALLHIAREIQRADTKALARAIHEDEARWCAMLAGHIRRLGGTPSEATGAFYQKVLAIEQPGEQLAFVNKGQEWVVRKLREAMPKITDTQLNDDLAVMLSSHEKNIAAVARVIPSAHLPAGTGCPSPRS